jgi:tetratricopeptide (TPR) repeat protein
MPQTVQIENLKLESAIKEGNDLWRRNEFPQMLTHYKAIRHFFDESEPVYLRQYYCNLGIAYFENGDYRQAKSQCEKALAIPQVSAEEDSDIAAIHANLANALLLLGQTDEALFYLQYAEDYFRRANQKDRLDEVLETRSRALRQVDSCWLCRLKRKVRGYFNV